MRRIRLERAVSVGVKNVVVPGVDPGGWAHLAPTCAVLASSVPDLSVWFALGLHPWALEEIDERDDEALLEKLDFALGQRPDGLVAIGECGLDLARRTVDIDRQLRVLRGHVALARRHDLPLILHAVRCHHLLPSLLEETRAPPSVLHAFHGNARDALRYAGAGHHISLSGQITRPGPGKLRDAAKALPIERVLIETDAPDQTPWARRPAINEPAFVVDVAESLAAIRGSTVEDIALQTTANARRVFLRQP